MSEDLRPTSWAGRLLRGSVYLFVAVVLLHLTLALIREIWWLFLIVGVTTAVIAGVRLWWRYRNPWQ